MRLQIRDVDLNGLKSLAAEGINSLGKAPERPVLSRGMSTGALDCEGVQRGAEEEGLSQIHPAMVLPRSKFILMHCGKFLLNVSAPILTEHTTHTVN